MNYRSYEDMPAKLKRRIEAQEGRKFGLDAEIEKKRIQDAVKEERELQRACERDLLFRGIKYIHLHSDVKFFIGFPDLFFAYRGYAVSVELKSGDNSLEHEQKEARLKLMNSGSIYAIVRSHSQWEELMKFLNSIPDNLAYIRDINQHLRETGYV